MNYLVASLLVGLIMVAFLCILSLFENSTAPGGKARPISGVMRELLQMRR